ncbi:hypothetical protein NDU88_000069 [Pleurodeles waltl]|uniref:Uncharacterized protein n=1 Tax=Pleurodeles waltl TaxID=8319 RepID=A0AAV7L957_PLEWA|nr:hypothetical protein NDU88_000069 [Pleurodeles waltl]
MSRGAGTQRLQVLFGPAEGRVEGPRQGGREKKEGKVSLYFGVVWGHVSKWETLVGVRQPRKSVLYCIGNPDIWIPNAFLFRVVSDGAPRVFGCLGAVIDGSRVFQRPATVSFLH